MPETRRSQQLQTLRQLQQVPVMSQLHVTFIILEPFHDQSNPSPICCVRSTSECLNHIRQYLGETIEGNTRFIISATPIATRGYSQKALFGYDPSQRNQAGPTVSDIHWAVAEVERAVWDDAVERAENQERIRRIISGYEEACNAAEKAGHRVFQPGSSNAQVRRNRSSSSVQDNEAIKIPYKRNQIL